MASLSRNKRSLNGEERNIVTGEVLNSINGNNPNEVNMNGPMSKKSRGVNNVEFEAALELPDQEESVSVKPEPLHMQDTSEDGSSNYEIISSNEYYGVDPMSVKAKEDSWCSCPAPGDKGQLGCLDDCDNRAKRIECDLMLCKAGDSCNNRAMQLQTEPLLVATEAGVVVTHDLVAGSFIGQYTGQVMTRESFEDKLRNEYINNESLKLHVIPLTEDLVIDATSKGSVCRVACHSCSPNTEISVWKVEGFDCLAMYSLKDLNVNDVITFDHSAEIEYLGTNKRCNCGSINCKKVLGKQASARGIIKCGACQQKLLEPGIVGEVLLHPDLSTPLCQGCHDAYCRADWSASSIMCRWCCKINNKSVACVACGKQFCKGCLKNNLGPAYIKLAEHGSWTCLICDSRPLEKIRNVLWVTGEQEKGSTNIPSTPAGGQTRNIRPNLGQPSTNVRQQIIRPSTPQMRAPGVRQIRPTTPRTRVATPRGQTPRIQGTPPSSGRGGARVGTPFPIRMLGQSSVSIERVPRPPAPPPKQVQQRTKQTAALINQLQRYSGLSIQPVSESASQVENLVKDVELVYRTLLETCNEARKLSKETGLAKAKEKLSEGIRKARSQLADVESKV